MAKARPTATVEKTEAARCIEKLGKLGYQPVHIASALDVSVQSIWRWSKSKHEPLPGLMRRLNRLVTDAKTAALVKLSPGGTDGTELRSGGRK